MEFITHADAIKTIMEERGMDWKHAAVNFCYLVKKFNMRREKMDGKDIGTGVLASDFEKRLKMGTYKKAMKATHVTAPMVNDTVTPETQLKFSSRLSELSKTMLRTKALKENKTIYELYADIINHKFESMLEDLTW